jgi:hypothetical protein
LIVSLVRLGTSVSSWKPSLVEPLVHVRRHAIVLRISLVLLTIVLVILLVSTILVIILVILHLARPWLDLWLYVLALALVVLRGTLLVRSH